MMERFNQEITMDIMCIFFSTLQPAVVTPFYSKYAANFDGLIAPRIVRIATNKARIDIPFPARRNISLVAMVHALSFPNQ